MKVHNRLVALATAGLMVSFAAACGGSDAGATASGDKGAGAGSSDETITLRVAHNSNAAVLPARVAMEKGYFKEQGLDVKFTQVENIASLPPALDKSFDIVLSAPTLAIGATAQGIPMVSIASATVDTQSNPTAAVIASKASGITSIEQLKGKTLGSLSPTGTIGISSMFWIKKSGVDPKDVKVILVNGPDQADQMKAGRVDAVVTVAPFSTRLMKQPGAVNLGDPYLQMAPELSGIGWATSKAFADKNGEAIKKFVAALDEGIDYIKNNDADARKILQGYTKLPDEVTGSLVFPTYSTEVRENDLKVWLQAMQEVDGFAGKVDVSQMVLKP
jgi:ABC-type nitrate/sulfonate/bicarbonate transport system substrate-binding protein